MHKLDLKTKIRLLLAYLTIRKYLKRAKELLQKPVPYSIAALAINTSIISMIWLIGQILPYYYPSEASLQVIASIVESSASILAIFFAIVLYLAQRNELDLRGKFNTGEFFAACATFLITIFVGLYNMLFISGDQIHGSLVMVPFALFFASLFYLVIFFYGVVRKQILTETTEK